MSLSPTFVKAVDRAVAQRLRTFGAEKVVSAGALAERERRLSEVYLAGRISKTDYDREWQEIKEQRAHLSERPAPLFTQQRQILGTLVDKWDGMTNDDRTRMLAGIFNSISASAKGIDRMELAEDWRPYLIAAIPSPIGLSAERKTGLQRAVRALASSTFVPT